MAALLLSGCISDKDVGLEEGTEGGSDSAGSTTDGPAPSTSTTDDPEDTDGSAGTTTAAPPPEPTGEGSTSLDTDGGSSESGTPIDSCEVDVEALPECALDECSQLFEFECPCEGGFEGAPNCFEFSEGCRMPFLNCEFETPCERLAVYGWPAEMIEDEAAVTCVLEGLRDGTPGQYDLLFGGYMDDTGYVDIDLFVGSDGAAKVQFRDACEGCPESGYRGRTGTLTLQDPSHFEACLMDPTPESVTACLFGDVEMPLGGPPPQGWTPALATGACSDLEWSCPQG